MLLPLGLLLLYPLICCNQGVDLADTGYNIGTYRFMMEWDGYWTLAMPIANLAGFWVTCLPGGGTLLGVNVYTGLGLGAAAAAVYILLRRKLPAWCVFLGEVIALGLCWCPSSILYNYLTYFTILAALGALYLGLTRDKRGWLAGAGILLGCNVFVRFSNLTEMAFILAVWYYVVRKQRDRLAAAVRKDPGGKSGGRINWLSVCWKPTVWCLGGYVAGIMLGVSVIAVKWGLSDYITTVRNLLFMSDSSEGYSAASMLLDAWRDYLSVVPWLGLMGLGVAMGVVLFYLKGANVFRPVKILIYFGGLLALLRLFWGRRVLDTDYYSIGAVWYFGLMFVVLAFAVNILCLFKEKQNRNLQLLSVFSIITLLIAPLGTNNHAYATINNLFLAAPVTVYLLYHYGIQKRQSEKENSWRRAARFPLAAMVVFFLACITWQTIGFHAMYAFGDSDSYEKRDTKIENNGILKGMYTSRRKALNLESLSLYLEESGLQAKNIYTYGNIPALCYYLDHTPAVPMLWPDLDSYEWEQFEADLSELAENTDSDEKRDANRPLFVLAVSHAALMDSEFEYSGPEVRLSGLMRQKLERIYGFLEEEGYGKTFSNELFVVYQ